MDRMLLFLFLTLFISCSDQTSSVATKQKVQEKKKEVSYCSKTFPFKDIIPGQVKNLDLKNGYKNLKLGTHVSFYKNCLELLYEGDFKEYKFSGDKCSAKVYFINDTLVAIEPFVNNIFPKLLNVFGEPNFIKPTVSVDMENYVTDILYRDSPYSSFINRDVPSVSSIFPINKDEIIEFNFYHKNLPWDIDFICTRDEINTVYFEQLKKQKIRVIFPRKIKYVAEWESEVVLSVQYEIENGFRNFSEEPCVFNGDYSGYVGYTYQNMGGEFTMKYFKNRRLKNRLEKLIFQRGLEIKQKEFQHQKENEIRSATMDANSI